MRVADFVVKYLLSIGINDVFLVSGGGNMYLIDAIGRNKKIKYICNHHEQASSMAAEGYARMKNDIGVAFVTTGPGGTNAITGIAGGWLDSVPMLIISGQVKTNDIIDSSGTSNLRQFGDQEINIIDIVKPITKYAVMIKDKNSIKYHLQKSTYIAKTGRPGPVWLDIPLDIQGAEICEEDLSSFIQDDIENKDIHLKIEEIIRLLRNSEKPLFIIGNGIRISNAIDDLYTILDLTNIPAITAINGNDIINENYKFYCGRSGIAGQRGGNFAMQNCDLIISIGSRLMLRQIGFNYEMFAKKAKKVVIDIDKAELEKKSINPDISICCDAKVFLQSFMKELKKINIKLNIQDWQEKCIYWNKKYNCLEESHLNNDKYVNSYLFVSKLSSHLDKEDHIVTANGTAYISSLFSCKTKIGQRLIYNVGLASMGYGLPASIGACIANNRNRIICLENDGSLQMNIQELQTVVHYNLPIKIFIFNNEGYLSIKITQSTYFPDNIVACDANSGVSCPNLEYIASAYKIPYYRIDRTSNIDNTINDIIFNKTETYCICEIIMDPLQPMVPKAMSKKLEDGSIQSNPIEDMYPFMDRKEFFANIL